MINIDVIVQDKRMIGQLPAHATEGSAAVDLRASLQEDLLLRPGQTALIDTGLSIYIKDTGYAGLILPRSGLGHKNGIVLGNLVGLIDADYQGGLKVSVWNRGTEDFVIKPLDRIAQLMIVPVMQVNFKVVDSFEATDRGEGGFGSTSVA